MLYRDKKKSQPGGTSERKAPPKWSQKSAHVPHEKTHQVGGHDRVERLGLQHHAARHGVHQHLVDGDVGELGGDLGGDLVPEHHAVALGVALGHDGEEPAGAGARRLEREAHDPLDAVAREHGQLRGRLPGLPAVAPPALARVLALRVLAHDHPVQVARLAAPQRRLRAAEDLGRPHVRVLLEGLADGQAEAPERDVIGYVL